MSEIVWVLVIVVFGMYMQPVRTEIVFKTEAQCEEARAGVRKSERLSEQPRCLPEKKK